MGRRDVWTERHTATDGAVVRSFKAIRPCIHEWFGLSESLRVVTGHPFIMATVLRPSDQAIFQTSWLQRSSPFLADILTSWVLGSVLYIGLQIFTLWQNILRLGCVLYSMAYYIGSFTVRTAVCGQFYKDCWLTWINSLLSQFSDWPS